MATLKVYRTPIGFHDAYVAAPSQKAALAAWGSERDLFARGVAEVVTDAALTAEPLAHPGTVIRRSRGTVAEQLAALPPDGERPARRGAAPATPDDPPKPAVRRAAAPKPSRAALAEAEQALAQAEARHRSENRALRAEEAALARRRRAMEQAQRDECTALTAARQAAAEAYDAAMRRWRG